MKGYNQNKIGNKPGRPAFRTPSVFKYNKSVLVAKNKNFLNRKKG